MTEHKSDKTIESAPQGSPPERSSSDAELPIQKTPKAVEVGGPKGPDPVRYGDWEKGGRCIDF